MESKQSTLPGCSAAEPSSPEVRSGPGNEGARGGKARFQPIDRAQISWRTIIVERLIAEDHPARAIWAFVGNLDLSGYTKHVRAVEGLAGRPALDPQLLISLWVYAYGQGVGSARAIERLCEYDPAYQWLTGMEVVNAHSLSDFRVQHEEVLKGLFVQTLGVLQSEGLITLERVTQDGTKIRACAAPDSFRGKDGIKKALAKAKEQVEAVDQVPEEELSRRAEKARERARRERQERLESALQQFDKPAAEGGVQDKERPKVSTSDPEARIMKQPDAGFAPSYNVQLNTDGAHGLIVAVDVTQAGNDLNELQSGVDRVEDNAGQPPKQVIADGGYVSRSNIVAMESRGVDFIAPPCDEAGKAKNNHKTRDISPEYQASNFVYDAALDSFRCPQGQTLPHRGTCEQDSKVVHKYCAGIAVCRGCAAKSECCPGNQKSGRAIVRTEELPPVVRFHEKMQTDEARDIYRGRSQIAETPNLWIKAKFGLRRFSVRGLRKVGMESLWASLTYNIRQWIRLVWRQQAVAASATV
jgi:transposase